MRWPCCLRVPLAWSQRPPVSSASSWSPRGSPGPGRPCTEFSTLCSKHFFTMLAPSLEHVLLEPGPRLACPCSTQDQPRAGHSGTPTAGWTLLRSQGWAPGVMAAGFQGCQSGSEEQVRCWHQALGHWFIGPGGHVPLSASEDS